MGLTKHGVWLLRLTSQHFKANQGTRTMGRSKLLFVQVRLVFHFEVEAVGKTKRRSTENLQSHCTFDRRGEGVPLCRNEIRFDKTLISNRDVRNQSSLASLRPSACSTYLVHGLGPKPTTAFIKCSALTKTMRSPPGS